MEEIWHETAKAWWDEALARKAAGHDMAEGSNPLRRVFGFYDYTADELHFISVAKFKATRGELLTAEAVGLTSGAGRARLLFDKEG